jgi:hypothetical protein
MKDYNMQYEGKEILGMSQSEVDKQLSTKSKQEDERAKEFLSCLGNGKGRITDEDESPEDYVMKTQKELYPRKYHKNKCDCDLCRSFEEGRTQAISEFKEKLIKSFGELCLNKPKKDRNHTDFIKIIEKTAQEIK